MSGPLDRLDGSRYGDPDDHRPQDVAPPCDDCGKREAVDSLAGFMLCEECIDRDDRED